MRCALLCVFMLALVTSMGYAQGALPTEKSIYDLKVKDISGKDFDFSSLKGKKLMIVNTASKCRYTGQYADLQKLYETYNDSGFVIICLPSESLEQEFKTNDSIKKFCDKKYGITFPIMSKRSVTEGAIHPIYQFLTDTTKGASIDDANLNFQKYLIDVNGHLYKKIPPATSPATMDVIEWIIED